MHTSPRPARWWISPVIPTTANIVLAALWAFAAFGGWGEDAFCTADASCARALDTATSISLVPVACAVALAAVAWAVPSIRNDPDRLDSLLSVAAVAWMFAGALVFVTGWLAQS